MFELLEKEFINTIELSDKVRVSDPCYDMDTWCAGTLENVLPGTYHCFTQRVDQGDWGVRIGNTEVRHQDYLNIEPTEKMDIDVGVDSGQCGIYDLEYFIKAREDKHGEDKWYERVCDNTYQYLSNPQYVPFEESEFYKDEFKLIHYASEHKLSTDGFSGKEKFEYSKAYMEYLRSISSYKQTGQFTASVLDNKCLVSSSGDGDGSYTCLVGKNEEGKIVSIKIDYYYYYEEEE